MVRTHQRNQDGDSNEIKAPPPEPLAKTASPQLEQEKNMVEAIAKDLKVNLPNVNLPLLVKLVSLFTLVGGLSILGSAFVDIFNPARIKFITYFLRLLAGLSFIFISYGLVKRQRLAIWLYAALVLISLFVNPVFATLPGLIVIYLFFQRRFFTPSFIDVLFEKSIVFIASKFKKVI